MLLANGDLGVLAARRARHDLSCATAFLIDHQFSIIDRQTVVSVVVYKNDVAAQRCTCITDACCGADVLAFHVAEM